jgi:hypothetical protein
MVLCDVCGARIVDGRPVHIVQERVELVGRGTQREQSTCKHVCGPCRRAHFKDLDQLSRESAS